MRRRRRGAAMRLLSNSIDFSEWDSMKIRPCIVFPSMIVLINTVCHMSCILHEFGDPSRYFLFFCLWPMKNMTVLPTV